MHGTSASFFPWWFVASSLFYHCTAYSGRSTFQSPFMMSTTPSACWDSKVGLILLAGGQGKRMNSDTPKQLLKIGEKTILDISFTVFEALPGISAVAVVLDATHRQKYARFRDHAHMCWADPGAERQDSAFNGLQALPADCDLICIHDVARPLVTAADVTACIDDAARFGAAALGVPVKATVKESVDGSFVTRTLPRNTLWEMQTPQVVRRDLLMRGYEKVRREGLTATDDVSLVEALGLPVKITRGKYTNIKITTPEDLVIAEEIFKQQRRC